ncbi:MAG: autotransporter outer membrane beta-barrel domain-containing protein, partial [Gammaproteobacteria bacterium]|nr:autotransporter outer membrane beta-barrel domain-containing protein [Gammaproteobacteria bacterium]
CTEVIPTTVLMIPLTVTIGGTAETVPNRRVPLGERRFTLTAAEINMNGENHGQTLEVTPSAPTTASLPPGATATATGSASTEILGWTVTLSPNRTSGSEGAEFVFTFTLAGDPAELANGFMVPWAIAGTDIDAADFAPGDALSGNVEFTASAAATQTVSVTTVRNDDGNAASDSETFTFTIGALTGGDAARADIVGEDAQGMFALTITVNEDDPAARQARMKIITAAMTRSMATVADSLISRRFTAARAESGQSTLTIGGQTVTEATADDFAAARGAWAANPFERGRMLAQTRANVGGNAMAMSEILRASSFDLIGVGGGAANMWGAAETINFDDSSGATTYDGDSTSAHFGMDQRCGDDCVRGLSVSWTSGDVDFSDTVAGVDGKVASSITGVHPYLARWLSDDMFWWVTGGYGLGSMEIRETDNTFDTGATVRMLTSGISGAARVSESTDFVLRMRAQWTHATLESALAAGGSTARLPKTTSTTLRLGGEWEAGYTWDYTGGIARLHGNLGARRDFRDAKDSIAYDAGAGVHWTGDDGYTIGFGITTQISGPDAEEDRYNADVSWQKRLRGYGLTPYTRLDFGRHGPADWNSGLRLTAPGDRLNFTLETSRAGRSTLSGELRF